jgi:hypothetical protein
MLHRALRRYGSMNNVPYSKLDDFVEGCFQAIDEKVLEDYQS